MQRCQCGVIIIPAGKVERGGVERGRIAGMLLLQRRDLRIRLLGGPTVA